jgi:hypothetical protein
MQQQCSVLYTEWDNELLEYTRRNPRLLVVDSVPEIRKLVSRATMLDVLDNGGILLTVCCNR